MIEAIVEAIRLAVTSIPDDAVSALKETYKNEESGTARFNLENILRTIEIGKAESIQSPKTPER